MQRVRLIPLASLVLAHLFAGTAAPQVPPGQLYDPCTTPGCISRQGFTDIIYVEDHDEYFISYSGESTAAFGFASLGRMDPDGNWLGHTLVSPTIGATQVNAAYNTNSPGFYYVWRTDGSNQIWGAHLDGDGNRIAGTERQLGIGTKPRVAFSPDSGDFLVIWNTLNFLTVYNLIDGDDTNPNPVLWAFQETTLAFSSSVEYGSGTFLVVFQTDFNNQSNVGGRFISPTGGAGNRFDIDTSSMDEQNVEVAYFSGIDRFFVTFTTWRTNPPHSRGKVIHPQTGAVTNTGIIANAGGVYEITGASVYNETSQSMWIGHYHGPNFNQDLRVQEWIISDNEFTKVGNETIIASVFGAVKGGATRNHPTEPQATFLYSEGIGFSGLWASIVEIDPPPPDETAPAAVVLGGNEGPGADEVTVTWLAPGDDDNTGTADSYDLRYSLTPGFNFASGTPVATADPKPAGTPESAIINGLPAETLVYVLLQSADEVPNLSPLSNEAAINTPGIPPDPVTNLAASSPGGDSAFLTWTATGDDGMTGTATSYDVRWSTSPISDANFDAATPIVGAPVPGPPTTAESFTATGLPPETMVYFGIKVVDDAGLKSPADTGADPFVTTLDLSAPEMTDDLAADSSGGPMILLPAVAIDASSELRPDANATDGDLTSYWSSLGSSTMIDEFITVDVQSADKNIGRVRLRSRDPGIVFPEDLQVQISTDNVNFTTVHTELGLPDDSGVWHELDFIPMLGQYVRIYVTKTRSAGDFFAQIAEVEVYESPIVLGSSSLSWTAPGDNADQGTATSYDLRWSLSNITPFNFGSATPVDPSEIPTPSVAGTTENTTVTGLPAETMVYFALKTSDEIPNVSTLSNVVSAQTAGVAPDAIDDFMASAPTGTTVDLDWTAVGDDGLIGTATSYDLRVSTSPITAGNFDAATNIPIPAPATSGTPESYTATGLTPSTNYYFAIKTADELGNWSPIHSNGNVMAMTLDTAAPEMIDDLVAVASAGGLTQVAADAIEASSVLHAFTNATDDNGSTYWTSTAKGTMTPEYITVDTGGADINIGRVSLLSRSPGVIFPEDLEIQISSDNVNWTTVHTATGLSDASAMTHDFDFPGFMGRYVRVYVTKTRTIGSYYAQIAEIDVFTTPVSNGAAALSWTAPGDDAAAGTATSYDIRWSLSNITAGNFNAANQADPSEIPMPSVAGTAESTTVSGLPSEELIYFAIKASDEIPNVGPMSNVASTSTVGVPPDAISDFAASGATGTSVDLDWTAVGDDGLVGTAAAYDLRVSTGPINEANFLAATNVPIPAPAASGTPESFTVPGLPSDTLHYFAIKVRDEQNNWSPIHSNGMVFASTLDVIAPSAVSDLTSEVASATLLPAPAIDVSSELGSKPKENATDGSTTTFWSTPAQPSMVDEYITVDTGDDHTVGRVRLLSRNPGIVFPEDFQIQISSDNVNFTTLHTATGVPADDGVWHQYDVPATLGRYVRIYITKTRNIGAWYAQIAEIEVYEVPSGDALAFSWTAPGDDGTVGTATSYDLRYSSSAITSIPLFNAATPVVGEPVPVASGLENEMNFPSPQEGVTLHFALRTTDDSGNLSPLSNDLEVTTAIVPPAAVTDLAVSYATSTSALLTWTATGDSGTFGTATSYEMRYSTSPIDDGNFNAATLATGIPTPNPAGTPESMTVTGLSPNSTYYFGLKVHDETAVPSLLSNIPMATTDPPDVIAPSAVTDFSGGPPFDANIVGAPAIAASSQFSPFSRGTDGSTTTYWSSTGKVAPTQESITLDSGAMRDFTRVRLMSRTTGILFPEDVEIQLSDDNVNFTTIATRTGLPDDSSTWHAIDFPPASGRYVKVLITKTRIFGGLYYAQIAEIEAYEGEFIDGPVALSWTAPGDDAAVGMASEYDLRWSFNNITVFNFGSATQVPIASPSIAGTMESVDVATLPVESDIYLALKTKDEVPNTSGLSNVIMITTAGQAPAAIGDLSVDSVTGSSADLSWTAPGDDGNTGQATSYDLRWSTAPIDDANFLAANQVLDAPAPKVALSAETHTVTGLPNETTVYFAIKTTDDAGLTSPINTNLPVMDDTLDEIAPEMIDDLTVSGVSSVLNLVAAAANDASSEFFPRSRATDGNPSTFWSSGGAGSSVPEYITVDLTTSKSVGRVRLLSRNGAGILFPEDIDIQVSDDNVNFTTIHTAVGLGSGNAVWHEFDVAGTGRYVRIAVTKMRDLGGTFYAQIAEIEIYESGPKDALLVTWTAPGDDADQGTATSYTLKYSTSPINAGNFAAATDVATGAPQAAGATESVTIESLGAGTYYVAIKATDNAGNVSILSNLPSDTIP